MRTNQRTVVASAALAVAAGIHASVMPGHFRMSETHGTFFAVAAIAQLLLAVAIVVSRARGVAGAVIGVNGVLIAAWLVSRSGAIASLAEPVGVADLVAVIAEAAAIFAAVSLVRDGDRRIRARRTWSVPVAVALVAAVSAGAAVAAPVHVADRHDARAHDPRAVDHHHGTHEHAAKGVLDDEPRAHLHPLREAGDRDPGVDPSRTASSPLDGTAVDVGAQPSALAAGAGAIWVANRNSGSVTRVDPRSLERSTIAVPEQPSALAFAHGLVWVASYADDVVVRIDPRARRIVGPPIVVGAGPVALAASPAGVWVATVAEGLVQHIDANGARASEPIAVGFGPVALAATADGVWVSNALDRTLVHVDARTRAVSRPVEVARGNAGLIVAHGRVWVASASTGMLTSIDPSSGARRALKIDRIALPGLGPVSIAATSDAVWVANNHDKTIVRVDPATLAVAPPLFFGNVLGRYPEPSPMLHAFGSLWVADGSQGRLVRIDQEGALR